MWFLTLEALVWDNRCFYQPQQPGCAHVSNESHQSLAHFYYQCKEPVIWGSTCRPTSQVTTSVWYENPLSLYLISSVLTLNTFKVVLMAVRFSTRCSINLNRTFRKSAKELANHSVHPIRSCYKCWGHKHSDEETLLNVVQHFKI